MLEHLESANKNFRGAYSVEEMEETKDCLDMPQNFSRAVMHLQLTACLPSGRHRQCRQLVPLKLFLVDGR